MDFISPASFLTFLRGFYLECKTYKPFRMRVVGCGNRPNLRFYLVEDTYTYRGDYRSRGSPGPYTYMVYKV